MDLKWDRNDHDETFSPMMRSGPCHFDFRLSDQSAKEVLRYCIVHGSFTGRLWCLGARFLLEFCMQIGFAHVGQG